MNEQQQKSAVAQLRAQIEAEHQSCVWALNGLSSGNSQHAFISRRMRHMDLSYKGLEQIIGEEQATDILCAVFDTTPNRLAPDKHTSTHPCCSDERLSSCQDPSHYVYQAYQSGLLSDEEMACMMNLTQG